MKEVFISEGIIIIIIIIIIIVSTTLSLSMPIGASTNIFSKNHISNHEERLIIDAIVIMIE